MESDGNRNVDYFKLSESDGKGVEVAEEVRSALRVVEKAVATTKPQAVLVALVDDDGTLTLAMDGNLRLLARVALTVSETCAESALEVIRQSLPRTLN